MSCRHREEQFRLEMACQRLETESLELLKGLCGEAGQGDEDRWASVEDYKRQALQSRGYAATGSSNEFSDDDSEDDEENGESSDEFESSPGASEAFPRFRDSSHIPKLGRRHSMPNMAKRASKLSIFPKLAMDGKPPDVRARPAVSRTATSRVETLPSIQRRASLTTGRSAGSNPLSGRASLAGTLNKRSGSKTPVY